MLSIKELEYLLNHAKRLQEAWDMLDKDIAWCEAQLSTPEAKQALAEAKFAD